MSSFLENDTELCRNSIKFLHDACVLPELNVPALKSFYSTKRRLMELRKCILLPSNFTRTSITCQRCLINLKDGPASYTVIPAKQHSHFSKKILIKQQSGKPLTKFQEKYLKRMSNFSGNHMAITCKFCNNKALIKMQKPKKLVKPKVSTSLKVKKKKKKDKFCGLKQDAVLSITTQTNKNKIVNMGSETNIKKKKKKDKLNHINLTEISFLTPQNLRNLDDLEKTEYKRPKMKIKKIEEVKVSKISKENLVKSKHKLKKKKQNLNKLSEMLNKSENKVKKVASSLNKFLQGL